MFPPYDSRSRSSSINLRNQFLSNAQDPHYYEPYPHHNNYPNYQDHGSHGSNGPQDDFEFGSRPVPVSKSPKQLPTPPQVNKEMPLRPNEYEMSDLNNQNGHNYEHNSRRNYEPLMNPMNRMNPMNPMNRMNPFQTSFDSSYDPPLHNDPFKKDSQTNIETHDYTNFSEYPILDSPKPQPPLPSPSPPVDEVQRQRINEKNRLRQLRRKPRFHYTKLPYVTMLCTLIQVIVFIVELARMSSLTGSAFQTKPYFNPMLGPSTYLLINMGARYVPCMHQMESITNDTTVQFPCPNSTSVDTNVCSLPELCGLSGIPLIDNKYVPDQWYRIFVPIFLHAGFLHIIFNLLLQVTMGSTIERNVGFIKYFLIYISSGIAGFLLGANFSPDGIASTGASGALFGIMATNLLMFAYCGRKNSNLYGTKHYALFICIMVAEIIVSLVLGLLPGLDNFSHMGGFAMGLLTSLVLLPDPSWIYIDGIITYTATEKTTWQQGISNWNPMHNFDDKLRGRFYAWCGVRGVAFVLIIVYFVTLAKNFFNGQMSDPNSNNNCKWCKYINCIPVNGWCDIGQVTVQTQDASSTKPTSSSSSSSSSFSPTTTSSSTSAYPSSVENTGGFKRENTGSFRRRRYYHSFTNPPSQPQISSNKFVDQQSVGLGFYVIIALLTFSFLKRKYRTEHN